MVAKSRKIVSAIIVLLFGLYLTTILINNPHVPPFIGPSYQVIKVIDGDTIVLKNGRHLRYIGIDTPEINWKNISQSDCYAWQAREINKKLVLGKKIKLKKDVSETDKYNRFLRYVYVGNLFVNDYLIKQGYAHLLTIPPDIKYSHIFKDSQKQAKKNNKGLWNSKTCK